jgi:DNA polymerase
MVREKNKKIESLRILKEQFLNNKKLPFFGFRRRNNYLLVAGEGSCRAKIMFVGEAPGRNEAKTGRPFCGAAGKVFDELLAHIDMKREDIFITNIVKDRPPQNRDPLPKEVVAYAPYLDREIEIIQPKIIVGLGRFSVKYLLQKFGLEEEAAKPISQSHGKVLLAETFYGKIKIVTLYHPAVAVYNRKQITILKKDFGALRR